MALAVAAFCVRAMAASVLVVYGLGKLVLLREAIRESWAPWWVQRSLLTPLIGGMAAIEVGLGLVVLTCPMPRIAIIAATVILMFGLTSYGTLALKAGAGCGCSGRAAGGRERSPVAYLCFRNLTLTAALVAGVALGPTFPELTGVRSSVVAYLAFLPMICAMGVLAFRVFASSSVAANLSQGRSGLDERAVRTAP